MLQRERLLDTFLELARIPSPPGGEAAVAEAIAARLARLGLPPQRDAAGNLLAHLSGAGEPLLLTAHMDTVVPCEGVRPVLRDGVVYSDGSTVLGADDKSGIAAILEVLEALVAAGAPHCPLEVLFTVQEEVGLQGIKRFDASQLRAHMGLGLDAGGDVGSVVISAPSQDGLIARVHGRAAHAGISPEAGINAIVVAAEAITCMPLGRIDAETTANIGVIQGGAATNIVPELALVKGEARSLDEAKLDRQVAAMTAAFEASARAHGAAVEIEVERRYRTYRFEEEAPVIQRVARAMRAVGIEPLFLPTGGGSDANVLHAAGIPTVQIATGMAAVHTTAEHIAVDDLFAAARIVLACVQG
ncbi:MAG: M20/M25/M40 family metallo-hydrolase [Chloroflexota bacterium]